MTPCFTDISSHLMSIFWRCLKGAQFIQRLARPQEPFWSLQNVLDRLVRPELSSSDNPDKVMEKTLLFVALMLGHHLSQLHALTRHSGLTKFAPDVSYVSLTLAPCWVAKKERKSQVVTSSHTGMDNGLQIPHTVPSVGF